MICRYDSPDTLFYCDPPYPHDTRGDRNAYAYEMTDADHERLAHTLRSVQGKVALSGYRCALYDRLYADWYCVEAPAKLCHSVKTLRRECLWINYALPKEVTYLPPILSSNTLFSEPSQPEAELPL